MVALSFISFLVLFVLIGLFSGLKSKKTSEDYLLASRAEKPWMIALCAVATNNSGYMFIGIIGYTYLSGLAVIWIFLPFVFHQALQMQLKEALKTQILLILL